MKCLRLINAGLNEESFALLGKVVRRKLDQRGCGLNDGGIPVTIQVDAGMKADAYRIASTEEATQIRAGGTSGAFAGIGDYLRHCRFDGLGGFVQWTGETAQNPENALHGMYFASHFHNYYEDAPLEKIFEIIEDIALRGCNALGAWYDMHQFAGVDTPESALMIRRLKALYRHAAQTGMHTVFLTLGNESFHTSDPSIRAEWTAQNGYFMGPCGHYHVEICPNKAGGLKEILRQRCQVMEAFSDIPFDYVSIWPYDQGGCTCAKCAPWGANGFLKTLDALHGLYSEMLPKAKILCSTWYFDRFIHGEWNAFIAALDTGKYDYIDSLYGYFFDGDPVPEYIRQGKCHNGKRMVAFPEISMHGATPWGGFGANPLPDRLAKDFRDNGGLYCGAIPYSEGMFEDINKALELGFFSGRTEDPDDILREYGHFELCLNDADTEKFVRMSHLMETTLMRGAMDGNGRHMHWQDGGCNRESLRWVIQNPQAVEEVERLAAEIDAALPDGIRSSWQWQILRIRAAGDAELAANDMHMTGRFDALMEKLEKLYFAKKAFYVVRPMTRGALEDPLGGII